MVKTKGQINKEKVLPNTSFLNVENRALFLDRDGIINQKALEGDYIKSLKELKIIEDIYRSIKLVREKGWVVVVVTNQRGVARGLMSEEDVELIHQQVNFELKKREVHIDGFFWCKHDYSDNCNCRKPKPGLFLKAAKQFNINLSKSYYIGDTETDLIAGINAGVRTKIVSTNSSIFNIVQQLVQNE